MKAKCPYCGTEEDVPKEYFGETGICEVCGQEFIIGGANPSSHMGRDNQQNTNGPRSRRKLASSGMAIDKNILHILKVILICGALVVLRFAFAECIEAYRRTRDTYVATCSFESTYNESRKTGSQTFRDGYAYRYEPNSSVWRQRGFKKLQVISIVDGGLFSDDGAIVSAIIHDFNVGEMLDWSALYYISGIDKSRLVDGDTLPSCTIIAGGTYSYTTAGGVIKTIKAFRLLHRKTKH